LIPAKLLETIFHRVWLLALPVILVPLVVVLLTRSTPTYESWASVWASAPVGDSGPAFGQTNSYVSPAQNQVQVLGDLLSTDSFREQIAIEAGMADGTDPRALRNAVESLDIGVSTVGTNLVSISASSGDAAEAQAVVAAVISQYQMRAATEIQRRATASVDYYTQQLSLVDQTLAERRRELAEYLRANPKAANPEDVASEDPNYRALVSQVETQVSRQESLQLALQEVKLNQASAPSSQDASFSVQDAASLPEAPLPTSSTTRFGLPFAGLLFGIMISAAYVYFTYRTDHTIRSAADVGDLDVPLLGSVPDLRTGGLMGHVVPIRWALSFRHRDFARRTAASISARPPAPALPSGERTS
jgi:capsular polysaccharide biosynthesis protein